MDEQRTVAKGTFWALLSQVGVKFLAFVYLVIIARFLPTDIVGLFYLALSVLGIILLFTDFGITFALNRYIPFYHAKQQFGNLRKLVNFAYAGGGGITLLVSLAIFFFAELLAELLSQPLLGPVFRWLAIWLFLQKLFDISRGILNGMKKVKESQLMEFFVNAVRFLLTIIAFFWVGFNISALILPYLLSFLLGASLALYYVWKEIQNWSPSPGKPLFRYRTMAKDVLSFGFMIMVIFSIWTLTQYVDRIMINYIIPDPLNDLGIYTIAVGLASLIFLFPSAISAIFFPVISELYGKEKPKEMQRVTGVSVKWLVMLSIPVTLIMLVFPEELLQLFYGQRYVVGYGVLALFTLAFFIRSLSVLPGLVIAAMRRLDIELIAALVSTGLNILFNWFFIPLWGINGAAFASVLSLLFVTVVLSYYGQKLFGFSFRTSALRPLLAGFLTLAILFLAKPFLLSLFSLAGTVSLEALEGGLVEIMLQKVIRLLIFGLLFILVSLMYFIVLLVLKILGTEEITLLQSALRRAKVPEKYIAYVGALLKLRSSNED